MASINKLISKPGKQKAKLFNITPKGSKPLPTAGPSQLKAVENVYLMKGAKPNLDLENIISKEKKQSRNTPLRSNPGSYTKSISSAGNGSFQKTLPNKLFSQVKSVVAIEPMKI